MPNLRPPVLAPHHPAVKAIKKVDAIRSARQDRFYEARMSKAKKQQAAADRRQLEQEIHLVKAPGALAKEKEEKLKGGWGARVCACGAWWGKGAGRDAGAQSRPGWGFKSCGHWPSRKGC